MIIENNKIIEATEEELFDYYLDKELYEIFPFPDYMAIVIGKGAKITKDGEAKK